MKNKNLVISRKMISLLVAGGIVLTPMTMVLANSYKENIQINQQEEKNYYEYCVVKGDNLSQISRKLCFFFGEDVSTKYWPALAFLNDFPKVLQPGDIIKFPKSFEGLVLLNETLRKENWTAKYIQNNNIYGKKKNLVSRSIMAALLEDIYGDSACVDDDFILKYLDVHGLLDEYELTEEDSYKPDIFFQLTEWIPTLDELELEKTVSTGKKL